MQDAVPHLHGAPSIATLHTLLATIPRLPLAHETLHARYIFGSSTGTTFAHLYAFRWSSRLPGAIIQRASAQEQTYSVSILSEWVPHPLRRTIALHLLLAISWLAHEALSTRHFKNWCDASCKATVTLPENASHLLRALITAWRAALVLLPTAHGLLGHLLNELRARTRNNNVRRCDQALGAAILSIKVKHKLPTHRICKVAVR